MKNLYSPITLSVKDKSSFLSTFIFQFVLLFLTVFFSVISHSQWINWQEETDTRLILSSVANSDGQEKDISVGDLDNDGWDDVIVVRKEPFSIQTAAAETDLLLMNINGVLTDQTAQFAPEFLTNLVSLEMWS
jgi:hypothetical protein